MTDTSRVRPAAGATRVDRALADADSRPFWTDRAGAPEPLAPLAGATTADLVVVGGGLTGLWAALQAVTDDPGRDVLLLEAETVACGASGRNGGFVSESLTHGLSHGASRWPQDLPTLLRLGRANIAETAQTLRDEGIDAAFTLCGKSLVAVRPHHLAALETAWSLSREHGEDAELLDGAAARADVASPTYLGALRLRSSGGLVDPALLCWGLLAAGLRRGVRLHEGTPVEAMSRTASGVRVDVAHGSIQARQVLLATNAYRPLLRRLSAFVVPVHDHVLVTEPLTRRQLAELSWRDRQGVTDAGNQFHYYRLTPDDRILWGGYDANYYFGSRREVVSEQQLRSHRLLARHFFETFPQLDDLRFTHRWAGLIDTTSRFTPMFGTAWRGRVGYAVGYTGLGVGSSRFGARVALDLLAGRRTEATELAAVRTAPVPFPPEPVRWPIVSLTRSALAREDVAGSRGRWLRLLDRLGVGFDS